MRLSWAKPAVSSGPDFFFVSQTAISRSRREAMMGVLGITCGVMVWAGVALLGLNLILARMAWLHNIIMVGEGFHPVGSELAGEMHAGQQH
ncbi:LysE family transporter, partial [Klebsiella pneumoniae]|uniref:LysE family transporter n=1 Tax=Klebsiella pneumoniae TaxID=573 RepID=UPI0035BF5147|nr:hypothetical protein [Klebsiella pneumoniae]